MSIVLNEVTENYAKALIEVAKAYDSLTEVKKDIAAFNQILLEDKIKLTKETQINKSIGLKELLEDPIISKTTKKLVVTRIFYKKVHSIFSLRLVLLLIDRDRIEFIEGISKNFFDLVGAANVEITLAAFTYDQLLLEDELSEDIKNIVGSEKYKLSIKVDPQLLGGHKIVSGSKVIDASFRSYLKSIK